MKVWNTTPTCPRSFNCTTGNLVSFDIGVSPSYVSLVSCSLSCLGSILILLTFCLLKDLRTTTQKIITLLAVADLISAIGYILGSINFLTHFNKNDSSDCSIFLTLCKTQSTITSWSSLVSFCWTVILAFHFFLIIVFKRFQFARKLLPVYNILAWGVPLVIIVPLLVMDKLGYAPYAASNWCYIKDYNYSGLNTKQDALTIALILVAGKGWEFISYASVAILYLIIFWKIHRTRRLLHNTQIEPRMLQIEWRLLLIPVLFIFLRMWGTIQLIVSLSLPSSRFGHCITPELHTTYLTLGILQAIGDGGQGWGNAILYILLSPTVRTRLYDSIFGRCQHTIQDQLQCGPETDTTTSANPVNHRVRNINVNKEGSTSPLIPHCPATGYNIRKYDSTSSSEQTYSYESMNSTAA